MDETFPDLGSLSDAELKELIDNLTAEEEKVSYQRRILHGKIDILRAELVNRLRKKREEGESVISGADVQQLTDILAGKALGEDDRIGKSTGIEGPPLCTAPSAGSSTAPARTSARSAAPTWPRRKARATRPRSPTRSARRASCRPVDLEQVAAEGGALVIRSGGGRAGESFAIEGERMTIGRSPDAGVFLDDVTVSRNHALVVKRRDGLYLDDLGSLNGTYVNRRRIESHKLQHGDELQVGKYKLTYLER